MGACTSTDDKSAQTRAGRRGRRGSRKRPQTQNRRMTAARASDNRSHAADFGANFDAVVVPNTTADPAAPQVNPLQPSGVGSAVEMQAQQQPRPSPPPPLLHPDDAGLQQHPERGSVISVASGLELFGVPIELVAMGACTSADDKSAQTRAARSGRRGSRKRPPKQTRRRAASRDRDLRLSREEETGDASFDAVVVADAAADPAAPNGNPLHVSAAGAPAEPPAEQPPQPSPLPPLLHPDDVGAQQHPARGSVISVASGLELSVARVFVADIRGTPTMAASSDAIPSSPMSARTLSTPTTAYRLASTASDASDRMPGRRRIASTPGAETPSERTGPRFTV
eukprot:CAMPEP_0174878290 /NCGR_PEP_ID=MMETSP1114-20130205/82684_1 /TAXON_ID=312471 /ORGANISM="Neobodo designis, Strain CCAP 1951/1" /LENGTH=339 /DNA_ID=CAMNT_0016113677 /DNA_START=44 /DNA_END=1064 /DNA_ORIENTATION=-